MDVRGMGKKTPRNDYRAASLSKSYLLVIGNHYYVQLYQILTATPLEASKSFVLHLAF